MSQRISRAQIVSCALAVVLLPGCASSPKGAAYDSKAPPAPYLRIAYPDADTTQLQIASRRFLPARGKGPTVWLVGASHIGESNYYASLQRQLDVHTLVLYEGVGEHSRRARGPRADAAAPPRPPVKKPAGKPGAEEEYSLQDTMARSLGLVFQLEAMDYDRTNFLNSDLTVAEIQSLMQPGKKSAAPRRTSPSRPPGAGERAGVRGSRAVPPAAGDDEGNDSFQKLMGAMDGSSSLGAIMKGVMQFIGSSVKLQAMTKLALIETLGAIKADPSNMKGLPADMQQLMEVLIRERNKVVVEDLRAELKRARPGQSIAIFYGAGHLPDLEMRLRKEFSLRPAEDVWLPAFSVNAAHAGLSNFELTFLRSMIRSQLAPMTK